MLGGSDGTVEDWHRCVRNLSVSSRENWAHRLIDGTGSYWQSCGQEGKVGRIIIVIILYLMVKLYTIKKKIIMP
ncbi:putative E3 ubiquitin-protein ligase HERC2 [Portunus trituberculatus]|uniref:Putative E3 ubiquitin-protein ligase HERC2 n=1 Tax=Portunus trituberculatus TaxID=210409 RepID=A0A5B7I5Z9_PORTR|nr:putative E3 ubiquitin-protein ligase HERC2 [Portunus trituberculatus]